MGEAFTALLPTFLSTLVLNMLDGLVKKFQGMMNGQDGVKDIPQKRALEILQAGQRRLSERIDSSPPQKPSVPKRRIRKKQRQTRVSLYRPSTTSGLDNRESSKRQPQMSRDSSYSVEKVKQANSELVTEVEELKRSRNSDDKHSQATSLSSTHLRPTSLSNSESTHSNSESTTDSSVHLPSTDTAHTEAILVLSDSTSAEDHRPLRYSQPYTDSVTSSPNDSSSPQKPSVPKSRRKQRRTAEERVSLYRPSTTSGSDNREFSKRRPQRSRDSRRVRVKRSSYSKCDTNSSRCSRYRPSTTSSLNTREPSRKRPHRSRDSVKARAKSGSFSEYEVSPPLSNDEHSTADSAVGDSQPCESTVDERPTLLPVPSSPRHRLAQLKSRKQQSEKRSSRKTKLVTLSTFFHASGEFNKKGFITWVTKTVSKSSSYNHLRLVVHEQLFTVFGFSPMKVSLTAKERRLTRAVLNFVRSTNNQIPQEVENNLNALKNVFSSRQRETEAAEEVLLSSRPSKTEPAAQRTKTANVKRIDNGRGKNKGTQSGASVPRKSETIKPIPQTDEKEQDHTTEDNGVCNSADPSPAQSQTWSTPTSEQSVGVSVLDFANPPNPLDVIHSHMRVYSQCCPRHTIKNTVVIGTAYPAADAFGPKCRYCTIKDLLSDPSHSQFDFSRQLTWSTPTSEQSVGVSVLDFANPPNPLDVIHSHMRVYSQCCPRHTIKNTVVIGTAYPAADAFGPKCRYCTIKDLLSDPSHSQFNLSRQLSVQSSSNRHYHDGKGHQQVFDRLLTERHNRGALPPQLLTPVVTQSLNSAATLLVEQETQGAGGEADVGLESSTEPPLYCAPIESPPPNLSNTESVSDAPETPSELVDQKDVVTASTSTLCDNAQAYYEPTNSQPLEQATPPSDSVYGESAAVEPKDPVPAPLYSQEPHSDVCDPGTRDSTPDKEETVLPDGAGDEKAEDMLGVDVSTVAETEGDKKIQQFQPEFELPSPIQPSATQNGNTADVAPEGAQSLPQLDPAAQILPSLSQEEPPGTTEDDGPELEVVDNEVEPPLPATKPLAVGEPSLELALAEIRRQLKEEQDNAVAKLREGMKEEYENLVTEREMKLTAEVVKLKEANSILVAKLQRHTGFEHSQQLTNGESATDISQSSDETTDTTSVEDQRTRRPQQYSHPYTGSITSSAPSDSSLPQKPPVSESRKKQRHKEKQRISLNTPSSPSSSDTRKHLKSEILKKNMHSMSEIRRRQRHNTQERLSLYGPSTSSSSDTREPSKRRPRRSRESVKKKKHSLSESGRIQKQIFSLYRPSTSSGTEHSKCRHRESSSDSVKTETNSECETTLFDNHSPESTVKEPPTHHLTSPLHKLKSGAGRRRQTLRSKYKNRTKLVTLAKFFTATGRFNKEGFKTWLTAIVGRSSYNHLRTVVHHKPFAVFGFSSPKLRKLSRRERVIGRAVISLVSSKKFPVPPSVEDNLQSLKAVLDAQKKSSVSFPSKSEALKPILHGPKIENDQEESSVDSDSSANDTLTDTQPWTRPTPEECVGASLLHFANTSYLIHCPVKVRHPPQNTCPPYDTFGGNYYTIADQHSDPASHSQTDHTEELSAARSRDHEDSESHCVVPDITTPGEVELGQNDWARHSVSDHVVPDTPKPCEVEFKHNNWALAPHLVPSLVMQQLNKTTESHSSHCPRPKQSSEPHPPPSSHTHQENIISVTTSGPGHQGHNALVTAVGVESDTSLDLFSTSHSHHHETTQYTGSEASSSTLASKHQQKRDKETAKKGRKMAKDRRQFSSSESDTKPRLKRLKRLKKGEPQEKSSKQSSSTTDSSHDEPLPSKICASGNPPSFCEAVNKQHNVNSMKKDVEVSSSDSSGPCTVHPQPDNSCCSPFLAGLPKPTTVPQDTPNCSKAIALVRLHYKYCTNEIQIFNPHMAANLGEVIEELIGLFEHKLCTGGFTKMVIITDTENYHTDLDNIIQTCLLKKYYLQLVPRHQLKFGDPEQPHCISLLECSGERACVVGNPTLPPFVINGNRLRNLPGAAEEVAHVSHLFQCHPLTLKEASKEAITNKLRRAQFAHLATHEYNKGLVLSDAVLTSSDIEQFVFEHGPPELVVLNCCGTADTVYERESIALALLKVKVLAVVAVFGSVEDKLALEFAKLFYHNMIEVGLPATHALYNAQHEVYPPDSTHQYIYLGKDVKITN